MAKGRARSDEPAQQRRFQRGGTGKANWETVDRDLLVAAIVAAADSGGALRFGYSRDGGAYAVGIYGDGEPYTEFVRPSESMSDFLRELETLFLDIAAERKFPSNGA